jgi:cyclopropane-fatty-acyl-phospholipid synthase
MPSAANRVLSTFEDLMGGPLPIHVRCWDGSEAGPPESAARVTFRNRRALRRILWPPNEPGLARAHVSGDLDVDGDIFLLLEVPDLVARIGDHRVSANASEHYRHSSRVVSPSRALGLPPRPPAAEMRRKHGARHSKSRDCDSISHHYDVGNDFYRLSSVPLWSIPAATGTTVPTPSTSPSATSVI